MTKYQPLRDTEPVDPAWKDVAPVKGRYGLCVDHTQTIPALVWMAGKTV